jgi:hypothetical protein
MRLTRYVILILACLFLVSHGLKLQCMAIAAEAELPGLAKKYPGDKGIEHDPAVVFVERFDRNSVDELATAWSYIKNRFGMTLVNDSVPYAADRTSLQLSAIGGLTSGAHLYKQLSHNYAQLYVRYYVKYVDEAAYHHTGVVSGGFNPPTAYPQGLCCHWPDGDHAFSASVEVVPPFDFDFYTYWVGMKRWGDIVSPKETEIDPRTNMRKATASGNTLMGSTRQTIISGRWYCVEVRLKMNEPVSSKNGELNLWIDGVLTADYREGFPPGKWQSTSFEPNGTAQSVFEGFKWRTNPDLGLNWIWVLHYVTKDTLGHVSRVWYDNLVVAQKYIGPISPE